MDRRWIPRPRQNPQSAAMVASLRRTMLPRNSRVSSLPYFADNSVYRSFYKMFQDGLEKGNQKDCFATKFFAVADDFGFDQDQQMFVAGTLIEAGMPTRSLLLSAVVDV